MLKHIWFLWLFINLHLYMYILLVISTYRRPGTQKKPRISIYCAKITFNTIKYLLEGHNQSYFKTCNQCMSTNNVIVPLFPCKNMTCKVLCTKSVNIRHTCFTLFDRMPFLIGVEQQAFDRMCALAGII